MKPTTRGGAVAGVSVVLYAGGRVLGAVELSMLAAAGITVLALAFAVALAGRPELRLERRLHPPRVHAGTPAHAEIVVENLGARRTPVLSVVDGFTDRHAVRFAVPPVPPGGRATGAYRLPTERRGVYEVGPLSVAVTDPLGLVVRTVSAQPARHVTVYPRIEAVRSLPVTVGRDLVGGAVTDFSRSRSGDEFHSLREYTVGDDLRRVHWRSTARTGQLMIREHDVPWQTRATIVVDQGSSKASPAAFEHLVAAAASVATALHRQRSLTRLVTTDGLDTGWGSGREHFEALLERLAAVEPAPADGLDRVAARFHRGAGSGALVVFTGAVGDDELRSLATLGRRFELVVVVRALRRGEGGAHRAPGCVVVDTVAGEDLGRAWDAAVVGHLGRGAGAGGALR